MRTAAMDNGEGELPDPSYNYNPSAPSQPAANINYVDQNVNTVVPPQAANIKYVDQNGNPVNLSPSANIKYVDQNDNPVLVNPPQAANIKYVDQKGNPVAPPVQAAQPVANIQYVYQYGNPVAAPAVAGVPVQQPTVKYVDQYGNLVAAPGVVVAAGAINKTTRSCSSSRCTTPMVQQRTTSAVLGVIAWLILLIGLCVDSLAKRTENESNYDARYTCGWTEYRVVCDIIDPYYKWGSRCTDNELSYSDLCDGYDSDGYDSDGYDWCGTQSAAVWSLVTMLCGSIMCLVAVVIVQPWRKVKPCCCKTNAHCGCARCSFLFSMSLGILTLIIWFVGDEICFDPDSEMVIGWSMVCQIIGLIFIVISTALARA